jgi:phthiodiolone/phenolphthiodiolone dimycocerosates ketoreductase
MSIKPAAFLRTTLPLNLASLPDLDSGRYDSAWLPDHILSFWPDSIWTPEFTDLAVTSPSPHRYLDALTFAGAVAAKTKTVRLATCVVDTVRRHPVMLAQAAITLDHFAQGRFILGIGSGEMANCTPYGFDFSTPVSRFEEAIQVIRLLWESDRPVNFEGRYFKLEHARLDIEPYEGRLPQLWVGCSGPRMLGITGRFAEGWWPVGNFTPEDYAAQLARVRESAERAGRDPMAIETAAVLVCLLGDDAEELRRIAEAPLVKAYILQMRGDFVRKFGFTHPFGDDWIGFHEFDPRRLTREVIVDFLSKVDADMVLGLVPNGTPKEMALKMKAYVDAGLKIPNFLDYGVMAGAHYAARSGAKVRAAEDELMRILGTEA